MNGLVQQRDKIADRFALTIYPYSLCFILTHGSSSILSLRHTLITKIDVDSLR